MARFLTSLLAFAAALSSMAQAITGRVVDDDNTPLDFVNVVLLNKQ